MEHPAFVDGGSDPGIKIWTIDKFEPVPIESKLYGKFYNGDSYIVLKTTGDDTTSLSHDAHFWLGAKTTQDKKGSAAILTVTLDDMLGGKAVHHREVQGHESSLFLGYFKPAIRYLEGGNESGFNEVETNAGAEKRLLKLSGCDNMRIKEVPAEATSLTRDNCFILEEDHDIYVLMPEGAKATQRRKIISVANQLRDEEHNGRAQIEIIDEFSSDKDFDRFFEVLGSGSRDELADEQVSEVYVRENISAVYLYKVLLGDGIELVTLHKPFKQKQLASEEIYILDTPCSGVYVWIGRDVDHEARKTYNDIAQQYLEVKGYPSWVNITMVSEGSECSTFKQYFHNWDTVSAVPLAHLIDETDAGYYSSDATQAAATAYHIGKSASARGFQPSSGDDFIDVQLIRDDGAVSVAVTTDGGLSKIFTQDVYILTYSFEADEKTIKVLYLWIGADASEDHKELAWNLASSQEEGFEENVIIVRVPQGKEPKHFLNIFKGKLAILLGTMDDDAPRNFRGTYGEDGVRLFRVEGTELEVDMRAVQVPENTDVLEDDDVFVLETPGVVYVRNGKEANSQELEATHKFLESMVLEKEVVVIQQGEETDDFWEALGGPPSEKEDPSGWKLTVSRRVTTPVSLTAVTVTARGNLVFEELPPDFTQQDLSNDGVYILDGGEEIYLWQGRDIPVRAKIARPKIIEEYIEDDGLDRTPASALVVMVHQEIEPKVFRKYFPSWDGDMWNNQTSYEDLKNETKARNKKD